MRTNSRNIWIGFIGAGIVLGLLLWFVGLGKVKTTFARLTLQSLIIIFGLALAWMFSWSLALHRILNAVGTETSLWSAFLLFASSAFADNITPFGQAGGGPFSALLISKRTETSYETGLASITSFDALNLIPSMTLAAIGLSYYAIRYTVGRHIVLILAVTGGAILCLPIIGYTSWHYSAKISDQLTDFFMLIFQYGSKVIPSYHPPSRSVISDRVDGYFRAIKRIGTNPRDLITALIFTTVGWVLMSLIMYVSIQALMKSPEVPVFIVLIVVPLATIASVTPLPGGTGGVEVAITLLLLPMGISKEVALGAALIYRFGTYWFSTVLGGMCVFVLEVTE
jgi:glycosyltransferase 2 family protein